jgi:hypothetical protein|tara:strand:- start:236 stop:781 length:546 start_codon:yes stop_codon:yes gene_type:complete
MVRNKTYNNVIMTLEGLGVQHKFIKTTTVGDIYDIDLSKQTLFPLMHINPTSVTTGASQLNYNFQIFVCDLVSEKEDWKPIAPETPNTSTAHNLSNEQEVLSDCLSTCVDIISIFRNSKWQAQLSLDINAPVYFTESEYSLEPFTERFDNLLTGWVFQLTLVVQNDFQSCDIPMADVSIGK